MARIDLPRALQDYFAFAEMAATRSGRRFSITLPYVGPEGRLDKLQWWYHISPAKEKALGDTAAETLRAEAIGRFSVHIERWLQNTAQVMFGDTAIPQVSSENATQFMFTLPAADMTEDVGETEPTATETVWIEEQEDVTSGLPSTELEPLAREKTAFG